jgi:hypothetical protein
VLQSEKRKTCRKAEDAEKEEKRGYINKQWKNEKEVKKRYNETRDQRCKKETKKSTKNDRKEKD